MATAEMVHVNLDFEVKGNNMNEIAENVNLIVTKEVEVMLSEIKESKEGENLIVINNEIPEPEKEKVEDPSIEEEELGSKQYEEDAEETADLVEEIVEETSIKEQEKELIEAINPSTEEVAEEIQPVVSEDEEKVEEEQTQKIEVTIEELVPEKSAQPKQNSSVISLPKKKKRLFKIFQVM